jgi:hypothetical protein
MSLDRLVEGSGELTHCRPFLNQARIGPLAFGGGLGNRRSIARPHRSAARCDPQRLRIRSEDVSRRSSLGFGSRSPPSSKNPTLTAAIHKGVSRCR